MAKTRIELGIGGIVLECNADHMMFNSGATITSELHSCELDCDTEQEAKYNAAIDGLESLILAHALASVDVTSRDYKYGIEVALDAISNQYCN